MHSLKKYLIIISALFLTVTTTKAQVVGQIFTATEADSLFGEVLASYEIASSELLQLTKCCKEYIMFRLEDGELHVLDDNRNILRSNKQYFDEYIIFKYYSISKITELIQLGGQEITVFENRQNVVSLTNGSITLERADPCPPDCPDDPDDSNIYYSLLIK